MRPSPLVPLLLALTLGWLWQPTLPAYADGPAPSAAAAVPAGPAGILPPSAVRVDPVRRRCKIAGAVLLGLAGGTLVALFATIIDNAITSPDEQSVPAGARLAFGLSTLSLGVTGSALLGYGLSAPDPLPSALGAPRAATLELRF